MTDSRKGLEFSYNLANLPESVEGADGASLTYSYLSDGSKWRASANEGPSILYRGSFVYEDDGTSSRISSIAWDEGRISIHDVLPGVDSLAVEDSLAADLGVVVPGDSTVVNVVDDGISDEWFIRDHLGSVRAIVRMDDSGGTILELNEYLPFGTRIPGSIQAADNRHRFGGKEEQRYGIDAATGTPAIDLGLLDFGARYYDPFTCRWTTRDPMAGKYHSLSPYNYCAGNPVSLVDVTGKEYGDYYNYWGNYFNSDGVDDGKIYLIDDLTITNYLVAERENQSIETKNSILMERAESVDGLIIIDRTVKTSTMTAGTFEAKGESGFSGYTMERPEPTSTLPNLNRPIPIGNYYTEERAEGDFAGGFAFRVYNEDVPKARGILGHIGNKPTDSSGCVLFGERFSQEEEKIYNSASTMEKFRDFYQSNNTIILIIR